MHKDSVKLTDQIAADIRARVKTLDFKAVEKIKKAKDQNGTFDVIISTESIDRSGEIVKQSGWDFKNYENNPIVLYGHDYYSLPIGICTELYTTEKNGVPATGARGVFYPAEINPLAQQVRKMYDFGIEKGVGVGCTTSVGFIVKEYEYEPENTNGLRATVTKAELLEFSFVSVPANQDVGAAEGRALTFDEARELKLDTEFLVKKGFNFVKEEKKKKEAKPGDSCTTEDGSAGVYASDPDNANGPLVCMPTDSDKSGKADRDSEKKLTKDLSEESERHTGEVDKALDEFKTAVAASKQLDPEETDETVKAAQIAKATETMTESLKALRASISDEQTMHRANSLKCFKSFKPTEDKAFDKTPHLKAVRDEHDSYDAKCEKALDELQNSMKAADASDSADGIREKLEKLQNAHKKSVNKIAKAMCKSAYGDEDEADAKTLEILKEFLTPHIDAQILPAVVGKIASRITTAHREKLGEAHTNLVAALAIVAGLHGALGDGEGEEGRSTDEKSEPAPINQRSRPAEDVKHEEDLNDHLLARDILRGVTTVAQEGLAKLKKQGQK